MGALCDWQIERDVKIEPREDSQSGSKVISYGVGSYGLDIRCGYKFKVFTPTHVTVVDPKDFNPKSFVEIDLTQNLSHVLQDPDPLVNHLRCSRCGGVVSKATDIIDRPPCPKGKPDYLMLPPHSFCLAESVEYLEVPRSTVGLVFNKSTYARCFSGETHVALADGTNPTFREMADTPDMDRWGYGIDVTNGRYVLTKIRAPRLIGREEVVKVTLDNGEQIICTPDHEFLRHGGHYTKAEELQPGDGVMPLYRRVDRGRESVWIPKLGGWLPTHWLADLWNLDHGVYRDQKGTHRHHEDRDKRNNNPTNIRRKKASKHIQDHNREYYGEGFDPNEHSRLIKMAFKLRAGDPAWVEAFREAQRERATKFWHDPEYAEARKKRSEALRRAWADGKFQHRKKSPRRGGNHTVYSVQAIRRPRDVYCLTSEDTGNFALESGVMVKNCGIVCPATVLEPEWKGVVTLEIANTTPLPAKIYTGEGIAQVVFVRSDGHREAVMQVLDDYLRMAGTGHPDPAIVARGNHEFLNRLWERAACRTSYADKRGKFQNQTGITLPFVQ